MQPGTRIGHYTIGTLIGQGGMGAVYRATDASLGREVAIKVLPEIFAGDPDRLARFEREARTLASLNHPNVAHVYGVESGALVMELVDGSDLSAIIARGPLSLAEALPIARQIADALEAAHEQGIIHRDLKPANVKVKDDGTVKVLDFGLAKALGPEGPGATAEAMNSPTLTNRATQLGMILGTAAYMSPEQAKGKVVDRRADVWAFGCVLYEMLTGRRAFAGDDVSDTLASVLRAEVDWSAMPAATPKPVIDLVRRCLERDVRQRLQAIGEARILLAGPASGSMIAAATAAPAATASPVASTRSWKWMAFAAAVGGAALAVVAMQPWRRASEPLPLNKFLIPTSAAPDNLRFSPDGRRVLFVAGSKLYVRDLDRLQAREISGVPPLGTGEDLPYPAWSPDGQFIVYGAGAKIWSVSVSGGTPTMICDSPGVFRGSVWREDGTLVLVMTRGPMYQVPARGGEPRVLLALNGKDDVDFHDPSVLPDGQSLVYTVHRLQGVDTIEALANGTRKVLMRVEGKAREGPQVLNYVSYSPTGHLLYRLEQGNAGVWAVPFSLAKLETTGEAFLVAAGATQPTVSATGALAYGAPVIAGPRQLTWFRPDGSVDRTISEPRKLLRLPRLAPDGRRVAFLADDDNSDVWVSNIDGSGAIRITFTPGNETNLTWIPGQNAIAFSCPGTGTSSGGAICAKNADGSGETRTIVNQADTPVLSGDGKFLLYAPNGRAARGLFDLELGRSGAAEQEYRKGAETMYPVAILTGNKFALFWIYLSGRPRTMLKPFPTGDGEWEVPGMGLEGTSLLPGGKVIAALDRHADGSVVLLGVPVETTPAVAFGPAKELFKGLPESVVPDAGFAVNADGTRLLAVTSKNTGTVERGIVVVQNWFAEFKK